MRQLVLNFPFKRSYTIEDFFISDANALAFAWLKRWPLWASPETEGGGFIAYGPSGCGKTHLIHAFCQMTPTYLIPPQLREGAEAGDSVDAHISAGATYRSWALDDVDEWLGSRARERNLFAIVCHCHAHNKTLLLTSRQPVRACVLLADLQSRLAAMPAAAITPPDDALLAAVISKLFHDRQRHVDDEVIAFMIARMERRFDVAIRLVAELEQHAAEKQQKITIPLVKTLLVPS